MITIVLEQKHQLVTHDIVFALKNGVIKGKLTREYYLKICFFSEILSYYMLKQFNFIGKFVILIGLGACTLYSYLIPEIAFSFTMIVGTFIWTFLVWIVLTVYLAGFGVYFLSVIYLTYRFKQVNEWIKDCRSSSSLISAVREHHEICTMNERNNRLLRLILPEVYYVASAGLNFVFVQAIFLNIGKIILYVYIGIIVLILPLAYSLAFVSARLAGASHGSYNHLNSIMAKESDPKAKINNIPSDQKFKIINLIERLAQMEITVWCLGWFPLNNFQFYLFIAGTAQNLILFTDLSSSYLKNMN